MNDSKTTPQTEAQLLPLAEAGDMNAALELAKLYLDTHNPALYKWANTLCAGGMPEGYYLLGKCYEFGIGVEDRPEFLDLLEELQNDAIDPEQSRVQMIADAEAGDWDGMYLLGMAYWYGKTMEGIPFKVDLDKAREWLEKAVMEHHYMASFSLGLIAEQQGDYATAINWYLRNDHLTLRKAASKLGMSYEQFEQCFEKGMEKDCDRVISRLASYYAIGCAVGMDDAIRFYAASANAGDRYGCWCLAKMCLTPEYFDVPIAEAVLVKLANAGDLKALDMLAHIYIGSHGQEFVDYVLADDMFWEIDLHDDIEAYYLLGLFYYYIADDKEWAYKALSHAASQDVQEAMDALNDLFGVN